MIINTRLEALHTLAEMRRMEISGFAYTAAGDRVWLEMFNACERFFPDNDPVWNRFANT